MSDEEDEVDVEVYYFFIIINLFMMVVFIWECSHKTQKYISIAPNYVQATWILPAFVKDGKKKKK